MIVETKEDSDKNLNILLNIYKKKRRNSCFKIT